VETSSDPALVARGSAVGAEPVAARHGDELLRALFRDGWFIDRQRRHVILAHPDKAGAVVIPRHKGRTLRLGTLSQIIDAAGLTVDEFGRLL
jgi:predicted RNA binding protein YcfA (HicA-like mRNA interferase family)